MFRTPASTCFSAPSDGLVPGLIGSTWFALSKPMRRSPRAAAAKTAVFRTRRRSEFIALPLNGWVHERRDRLACLDDISRQHPPRFRAEVARIMRGPRWDEESIPGVQYDGGTSLDHHLDLAGDDVADLFAWMSVPSGFDSRRNQRLHLHD